MAEYDATAAAVRTARDYGVDLGRVRGTGQDGRILASDVQEYLDNPQQPEAIEDSPADPYIRVEVPVVSDEISLSKVPHLYVVRESDPKHRWFEVAAAMMAKQVGVSPSEIRIEEVQWASSWDHIKAKGLKVRVR